MPLFLASSGLSPARVRVSEGGFPSFLPKEVEEIREPRARELAKRIERVPVKISFSKNPIMTSCVRPLRQQRMEPLVLLHGFDSSCLEWRYMYPLLEDAGVEAWAVDILGWGFSDLETLPPCDVAAKREHLYKISKLIFINASVYAEGTGNMTKLPKFVAYAGAFVLKSLPLRLYAIGLAFNKIPEGLYLDWTNLGRLHCRLPWWEDATVSFMIGGGYNVVNQIKQIKHKSLIIWGEDDRIISNKLALRLHDDIPDSVLHQIPQCGHIPHVEKPELVAESILEFLGQHDKSKNDSVGFSVA
ncbi:alpha/beta hydrolase domain-containing protein VTE7-like isoform X2 [Typha latifolia]|uniref:alpha/beta hydrolase domain-containing protein VTE7-like isoform X2 n=1 Tax=Typha latifolia TaxID=4733 RepID=UPI003C30CAB6